MLTGSLGMLPSASISEPGKPGVYEPVSGVGYYCTSLHASAVPGVLAECRALRQWAHPAQRHARLKALALPPLQVHGSAPDIAGQDKANPLAMVLSAAMMCRYGLNLPKVAERLEAAVTASLDAGYRTGDIMQPGCKQVGCKEMGEVVLQQLVGAAAAKA